MPKRERNRFRWTAECEEVFLDIKRKLSNAPILFSPWWVLDSDASDSRLGAVLSQVQSGRERVITYAARSLSKVERNYNTLRNELLALGWATENFETFLYGQHFLARTDHSALPWLENLKNPSSQVARWLERLSDFDFEVEHSQGQLHGNADGLSRLPFDEDASVKDTRYATLIQSVNMELVKGQSTCDSEPRSCSFASCEMA